MSIKRIYGIFVRQLFLMRYNYTRLSNIFLWTSIDLVLWGFVTKYLDSLKQSTFSFTAALIGAVILWGFLSRIQLGVIVAFLEDVWTQNFINFFASPLKISEYIYGLVSASILTGTLGFLLMILLGSLFFGYNIFKIGIFILPFLLILFLFGVSLGIFGSAVVLRLGPSAEWIVWPISAFLSPLAGVFYPIAVLPEFLQIFARLIPASYVFEGMRGIIITGSFSGNLYAGIFAGLAISIVYLFLSYLFFMRMYKIVLREGLISRFSAEYSS